MIKKRLIENAVKYCGIVEDPKNSNKGEIIDEIQEEFGFDGVQYCVLFVLYVYKKTLNEFELELPLLSTPSSQTLFNWAYNNGMIETDFLKLGAGDIVIWRKFKLWQGHAGIVISVDQQNKTFLTVEGNTSNNDFGDQRDGGGIYKRKRYMRKADFAVDAFYLRGFIPADKVIPKI
ncbi:MAG: CHAP domain-containing protein [Ignavibacterium sp.]|nr:CHAP domain-containing protein [Ignavibacterium sp.]